MMKGNENDWEMRRLDRRWPDFIRMAQPGISKAFMKMCWEELVSPLIRPQVLFERPVLLASFIGQFYWPVLLASFIGQFFVYWEDR